MINSILVTNDLGESVTLELRNPEQSGFFVLSIDGLGPVKATINIKEVLTMDGGVYNSARAQYRNIVIALAFDDSVDSIETVRQKTYKYFRLKSNVELEIRTDNRTLKTSGFIESNTPNIFSKIEATQISIICPNSYFFSTLETEIEMFPTIKLFEFPFENASLTQSLIVFGDIQLGSRQHNVINSGDVTIGAIFDVIITGDVTNIVISNNTNNQVMVIDSDEIVALTGSGLSTDDELIISTLKGNKYITLIRNDEEINVLSAFDIDSDWIELNVGNNVIVLTADSGISNTLFTIIYDTLYAGV